ncbi:MAG: carbohydrate-binding protein, partial [Bacteroidetes bacterium]|nr:carbohydrate-binding protein [Bacteroidota bacterium]
LQPQGTSSLSLSGEGLIGMGHRDRAAFKYIAFGNDVDSVRLRVLSPEAKATVLLRLDQPWGAVIARVEVPASTNWLTVRGAVTGVAGTEPRALWVQVLVPEDPEATLALDWLEFW